MAIFRNVHVTFWTDPKVVDDFTPEDKYFYVYLLTNPHTNLCGCYEVSMKQMSDELGYNKETIEKLIDRFHRVHRVLDYDKQTKEMLLYNWSKYNWTKSPKLQAAVAKEVPKVKSPAFNEYLSKILSGDTVSIPYPYGMDTPDTVTDTDTDSVSDNNKAKKPKKHKYGEYSNVLLTDEELEKLKSEFPDWQDRIERLSSYMASTGKPYKNHLATIRNWAKTDTGRKEIVPAWMKTKEEQARERRQMEQDSFNSEIQKYRAQLQPPKPSPDNPYLKKNLAERAEKLRQELGK